jgi:hypothetical protein
MENSIMPLYESLQLKTSCDSSLDNEKLLEISDLITRLFDKEGFELLYMIIKYYSIIEDNLSINEIPYKPKIIKAGLKYDFNNFPNKLINMICSFVYLHIKKLDDEKGRNIN